MTSNENVMKNIANEITRECHAENVIVETDFVMYFIDLFFLNPKYGNIFSKTLNRKSLEYFVKACVSMITRGETSINTLKMQFLMQTNYDKLQNLIDKHMDSITHCLKPLVNEILDEDPELEDEAAFMKLFRKISIYIILCSGLGNPSHIVTLKEGMAALESVFSLDELKIFVTLSRNEKIAQLNELMQIVSGVRLFNRDCKKGGEGIPDLPFKIVDAGKGCIASLSNALIAVMQRVNSLTTAVDDTVTIQEETGNIIIDVKPESDLTEENYKQIFELLAFNRQYEMYIRKLLSDAEIMADSGVQCVERFRLVLEDLHSAVKYKAAVPVTTVYPLFKRLWSVWRGMQNVMFLLSTVNQIMSNLGNIQDQMKIPYNVLDKMLRGKHVVTDLERMNNRVSVEERLSLGTLENYVPGGNDSLTKINDKTYVQYLGFCALCLCVGALVPGNLKVGIIKSKGCRYSFCNVKMATRFSKDPQRYVNEILDFARNNPYIIHLLNILEDVTKVRYVPELVTRIEPKTKVSDKDIQTETHPIDEYIEKNYSWDLWEWKRRACQWANIVNCQTHSTQTNYSHMRSEIHCQTSEPRHKCLQTNKDAGINTNSNNYFIWGLRGQVGYGQHYMDIEEKNSPDKKQAKVFKVCSWPCLGSDKDNTSAVDNDTKQFLKWSLNI